MLEYAYIQNDNKISVKLLVNSIAEDISGASKVSIEFFTKESDRVMGVAPIKEFNSITNAALFDITDMANGNIIFKPGPSDLALDAASYYTRWLIYSVNFPDGLVWGNDLIRYIVVR